MILQSLGVVSDPTPCNPNHANIIKWPDKKNARRLLALELAKTPAFSLILINKEQLGIISD